LKPRNHYHFAVDTTGANLVDDPDLGLRPMRHFIQLNPVRANIYGTAFIRFVSVSSVVKKSDWRGAELLNFNHRCHR